MNEHSDVAAGLEEFTVDDLRHIRVQVELACVRVGVSPDRTTQLLAAVNEIAVNAIVHAGGRGWLTVDPTPAGVRVEVSDAGPGLIPSRLDGDLLNGERPNPDAEGGRGLWMARRLCPDLTVSNRSNGLTVRMFMPSA